MAPLTVDAKRSNSFRSHRGGMPISEVAPGIATARARGRLVTASTTKPPAEFQTRRSAAQETRSLSLAPFFRNGTSELRLGQCKIAHLEKAFQSNCEHHGGSPRLWRDGR